MSRVRLNWSVIGVPPSELDDSMESIPAMVENCRSRGVATAAAMVSGLAPGSDAETEIVGKSTFGRSLIGSWRNAEMPNSRIASMTSVVMTGRLMNRAEKPMDYLASPCHRHSGALATAGNP